MSIAEIILNGVKVATSAEFRKAGAAIIEQIRSEPEWRRDVVNLHAKLDRDGSPQLRLLLSLAIDKLRELKFDDGALRAYKVVFQELSANALEHGLRDQPGKMVGLEMELCPAYTELTLLNPAGVPFEIDRTLEEMNQRLTEDSNRTRGRGLVNAAFWSETLTSTHSGRGVRALILPQSVDIKVWDLGGVLVLRPLSGHSNPSLGRRLIEQSTRKPLADVVLDFRTPSEDGWSESSALIGLTSLYEAALHEHHDEKAMELDERLRHWLRGMPFMLQLRHVIEEGKKEISSAEAGVLGRVLLDIVPADFAESVGIADLLVMIELTRDDMNGIVRFAVVKLIRGIIDGKLASVELDDRLTIVGALMDAAKGTAIKSDLEEKQKEIRDGKLSIAHPGDRIGARTRTVARAKRERGRLVVLLNDDVVFPAPPSSYAFSWKEVRQKLGRPSLEDPTIGGSSNVGPLPPPISL